MRIQELSNGNLLVPHRVTHGPVIADGAIEVEKGTPEYNEWVHAAGVTIVPADDPTRQKDGPKQANETSPMSQRPTGKF